MRERGEQFLYRCKRLNNIFPCHIIARCEYGLCSNIAFANIWFLLHSDQFQIVWLCFRQEYGEWKLILKIFIYLSNLKGIFLDCSVIFTFKLHIIVLFFVRNFLQINYLCWYGILIGSCKNASNTLQNYRANGVVL